MNISETLTIPVLANEMTLWLKEPDSLRFGQRIWNLYGTPEKTWPELFYETNELEAYSLLLSALYERECLTP